MGLDEKSISDSASKKEAAEAEKKFKKDVLSHLNKKGGAKIKYDWKVVGNKLKYMC